MVEFKPQPLTNEMVEQSDADFLIDTVHPGAPLVITFGFVSWETPPQFDFYGRTKKLEQNWGKPINRILVRDRGNTWYHRTVQGLGHSVDETAASLRELIAKIQPSRVITLGQSMGGYASIMFGILAHADHIISFGPLSLLESARSIGYKDRRWLPVMLGLENDPPPVSYFDLKELCLKAPEIFKAAGKPLPRMDIIFGSKTDVESPDGVNVDALHAERLNQWPTCRLHPYPGSSHAVVHFLISHKRINPLLAELIAGTPKPPEESNWVNWLDENLALGCVPDQLMDVLFQYGFSVDDALQAIEASRRRIQAKSTPAA